MLLYLTSIKLWHLAQQHGNFDSTVKHMMACDSLEDCANTFKEKDNERFIQASGDHYVTRRMGEENPLMIYSHTKYFHLTE